MLEELNKKYDILAAPDQKFTKMLEKRIAFNDGEEENRNFMIKNMLNKNYDHKVIADALGMSEKDAEEAIKIAKQRK